MGPQKDEDASAGSTDLRLRIVPKLWSVKHSCCIKHEPDLTFSVIDFKYDFPRIAMGKTTYFRISEAPVSLAAIHEPYGQGHDILQALDYSWTPERQRFSKPIPVLCSLKM